MSSSEMDPAGSDAVACAAGSSGDVFAGLAAAIDEAASVEFDGLDGDVLLDAQRSFEVLSRRVDALATGLAGRVDQTRAHGLDGHMNATAFVRHAGRVSGSEALGRVRTSRALLDLPGVAAAYRAGELSTDHVRLFARVWSNPRVRELLPVAEGPLLANALVASYRDFEWTIRQWERLADMDGAHDADEAAHRNRDLRFREGEHGWEARGNFGLAAGAVINDVFKHYVDLELQVDWDQARAEHGDDACFDDLPRTAAQRRSDAWLHLTRVAATAAPGRKPGDPITSIVMDKKTFDEELARLAGQTVEPDMNDFAERRCSTMTGHRIPPRDAVLAALYGKIRRVVIGADGAVINLGKSARFFTGSARDAALLANPECTHPGCEIPNHYCEADHLTEWSRHGLTDATTNGNPRCGFHNKLKNHGYRTWREPDGTWRAARPDGTPID